jgi:pilus assembly protein CpaE
MHPLIVTSARDDPIVSKLKVVLRAHFGVEAVRATTFDDYERWQGETDLVLVCLTGNMERGLEVVQALQASAHAKILAIGPVTDSRYILRALENGADHYLDQDDLKKSVDAWLSRLQSRREGALPAGRLLAILSASGGCGASTLAVNLAALSAKEHGRCNLIDLNLGHGDLAPLLNVRPQFTLTDVCVNEGRLDPAMYEKILVRHASGISLLASPCQFDAVRTITSQGLSQALDIARRVFPQVVVDLEDCFHDDQALVLQEAAGIVLVCRLDFTSLRNARRIFDYLDRMNIPKHRIRFVINRFGRPQELPVAEAEKALGEKVACLVPEDAKTINSANNTGVPAVLKQPSSKVALAIGELAKIRFDKPCVVSTLRAGAALV